VTSAVARWQILPVVVVVCLSIQLNPQAQNVSNPWREPQRLDKSELKTTKHESSHHTIEAPCIPRSRWGGQYECRSHASKKHEDPGREKDCAGPRVWTTDVARQHNTAWPPGNKNPEGLSPAPGEHSRLSRAVFGKIYRTKNIQPGMGEKGCGGHFDWGFVCPGYIPVNAQAAQWDCRCIPDRACERIGNQVGLYCGSLIHQVGLYCGSLIQGIKWDCTVDHWYVLSNI